MKAKTVEISDKALRKTGVVESDKREKTRTVVINYLSSLDNVVPAPMREETNGIDQPLDSAGTQRKAAL